MDRSYSPYSIVASRFAAIVVAAAAVVAADSAAAQNRQPTALKIVVIQGEDSVNIIQQGTAVGPVVEVRDDNDLPVAGVLLTFRINNRNAVFRGNLQQVTFTTDAAGRSPATQLTPLENGSYQIVVTATFQGLTATSAITQTNFANAAAAARAGRSTQGGQQAASGGGSAGGAATAAAGGGISKGTILAIAAAGGGAAAAGLAVVNRNDPPVVSAVTSSVSAALLGTNTPINFSTQASDANGDSLTYLWEFGDGGTSTDASPSHVYTAAGSFSVRLTVSDGKKSASSQTTVTIRTLTGSWRAIGVNTTLGPTDPQFSFTQAGSSVTGSISLTFPTASYPNCPITGFIAPTSPRVTIQQPPCVGTTQGVPGTFGSGLFLLDPGPDVNTLTGQIGSQTITLTRQ